MTHRVMTARVARWTDPVPVADVVEHGETIGKLALVARRGSKPPRGFADLGAP